MKKLPFVVGDYEIIDTGQTMAGLAYSKTSTRDAIKQTMEEQ